MQPPATPFGVMVEGQCPGPLIPIAGRAGGVPRRVPSRDVPEVRIELQVKCDVRRSHAVVAHDQLLGHAMADTPANFDFECVLWQRSEERRVGKECRSRWSLY